MYRDHLDVRAQREPPVGNGDTVDAYVVAIGRRLPTRQFEHNTLLGGPLDLAAVIPDAMTHFINKHQPTR